MKALLAAGIGALLTAVSPAGAAPERRAADAGTMPLRAELAMTSAPGICPPGTPADAECFARTGRGVVPGLGKVSESYTFVVVNETGPACPGGQTLRGSVGRFRVADKGEIELRIDASPECYPVNGVLKGTRPFSVTGGSGLYAGASGGGTLHHDAQLRPFGGAAGTDTWSARSPFRGSSST